MLHVAVGEGAREAAVGEVERLERARELGEIAGGIGGERGVAGEVELAQRFEERERRERGAPREAAPGEIEPRHSPVAVAAHPVPAAVVRAVAVAAGPGRCLLPGGEKVSRVLVDRSLEAEERSSVIRLRGHGGEEEEDYGKEEEELVHRHGRELAETTMRRKLVSWSHGGELDGAVIRG